MRTTGQSIESLAVTTIRTLSIDAVQKANSGHPGMPMGAAPMGYVLFARTMRHNPSNPKWFNRDRFVLSAGHGSMLLYSLLHLCGYDLPMEEIQRFRQWGSKTPGHPEYGHTPGVEATTGPLGQGIGMAVGMAMAEAHLAAVYNRPGFPIVDHYTYVICGDGDLMEGISGEAASLAGHLRLGKLIVLYDSNDISLDGELNLSFSENVGRRFEGYGWHYTRVDDGNDLDAIERAIREAQADPRPSLIEIKTIIGYGSPNKEGKGGHAGPHGAPLGVEEVALTKRAYGWPEDRHFYVPQEVYDHFAEVRARGERAEADWNRLFAAYEREYPELAAQFRRALSGELPDGWDAALPVYSPSDKPIATRNASGNAINAIAPKVPWLFGGSADLESSTMTHMKGFGRFSKEDYAGRNVYFGVREFAMAAAMNGMALHGGVKPYGGTFFVFSDYLRPAMRLAAIQNLPVVYVLTHDSIGVGEDGPTHEPVEQLAAVRAIPNMTVIRPADANETSQAWRFAMENRQGPVALVLTRQPVPILEGTAEKAREGVVRGAYVLADAPDGNPQLLLLATGSEVSLAMEAWKNLVEQGIAARVVSMPSWELFDRQPKDYRDAVLPPSVKARLAIEMAHPMGWAKYVGDAGDVMAIDRFGASAPVGVIVKEFGFTVENVIARAKALL
ncbi:MAG: transketolase [Candidatus Reconcilbacillus cellulovorans]|uniref:Transketolase n=1 Tax=Candidatus Reconcilbacillus cellulovorans TaxID=1906605 RepID=A0A2A6DYM7_9BACL|nr:MAG: transketolase [Candidatus Reconcilbacillus cellulovorans]